MCVGCIGYLREYVSTFFVLLYLTRLCSVLRAFVALFKCAWINLESIFSCVRER